MVAVTVLADRFCIAAARRMQRANSSENWAQYRLYSNLSFSAMDVLSCCRRESQGCSGGRPYWAWDYLTRKGAVLDVCKPYTFSPCLHGPPAEAVDLRLCTARPDTLQVPPCNHTPSQRLDGQCHRRFKSTKLPDVINGGEEAIQRVLLAHGPLEVGMELYRSLYNFTLNISSRVRRQCLSCEVYRTLVADRGWRNFVGGHTVKLLGWGEVADAAGSPLKYWIVANSWGVHWGDQGFFKIARGVMECGIERLAVAGIPLF